MTFNKKISLILGTYGRYQEVHDLLGSLSKQDCGLECFEVIIIDQNDIIDLKPAISEFKEQLNIVYYHSKQKGLALAKNKGIELSTAPIVTFPDDDCKYYPDTISKGLQFLEKNPNIGIVYGRLFDRENSKNIMRKWPKKEKDVTIFNFRHTYSAVTCFVRKNDITFDTEFGVGTKYGIGEELDYLLQTFNARIKSKYTPSLEIWHPELNPMVMSVEKVYYYATGFGAITRKHMSFSMIMTFILSCGFQIIQIFKEVLFFNRLNAYKRWLALKGRINGFVNY